MVWCWTIMKRALRFLPCVAIWLIWLCVMPMQYARVAAAALNEHERGNQGRRMCPSCQSNYVINWRAAGEVNAQTGPNLECQMCGQRWEGA